MKNIDLKKVIINNEKRKLQIYFKNDFMYFLITDKTINKTTGIRLSILELLKIVIDVVKLFIEKKEEK